LTSVDRRAINFTTWSSCIVCPKSGVSSHVPRVVKCEAVGFSRLAGDSAKNSARKPSVHTPASERRITTFERRGAMPDCRSLVTAFRLASSLALVVSVLIAPIRSPRPVAVASRSECLRGDFALPPGQPTARLSGVRDDDAVAEVNALPSENEEQGADALDEPRVSFLIPWSFRKVPDRQLIAPRSILSLYPLRC
jgi:hypothetical protein